MSSERSHKTQQQQLIGRSGADSEPHDLLIMSEEKEGTLAQKISKAKENNQTGDEENKNGFAQLAVQEMARLNGQEKSLSHYSMPGKQ